MKRGITWYCVRVVLLMVALVFLSGVSGVQSKNDSKKFDRKQVKQLLDSSLVPIVDRQKKIEEDIVELNSKFSMVSRKIEEHDAVFPKAMEEIKKIQDPDKLSVADAIAGLSNYGQGLTILIGVLTIVLAIISIYVTYAQNNNNKENNSNMKSEFASYKSQVDGEIKGIRDDVVKNVQSDIMILLDEKSDKMLNVSKNVMESQFQEAMNQWDIWLHLLAACQQEYWENLSRRENENPLDTIRRGMKFNRLIAELLAAEEISIRDALGAFRNDDHLPRAMWNLLDELMKRKATFMHNPEVYQAAAGVKSRLRQLYPGIDIPPPSSNN